MTDVLLERFKGLMPDGFDPSKFLDILKGDPDLLAKVKELLPDVDIEAALSGLAGAAAGAADAAGDAAGATKETASDAAGTASYTAGDAAGAANETAGGILDKVKDLFGR